MPPSAKGPVEVTVVTDSSRMYCDADCGADWSAEETRDLARQRIKESFGDRVRLEFISLAQSAADSYKLKLKEQIDKNNLSLPLLLVNGEAVISGGFDIRLLLDAVSAEFEIRELTYEQKL